MTENKPHVSFAAGGVVCEGSASHTPAEILRCAQNDTPRVTLPGDVSASDNSILELLDRVMNTGVVVAGDIAITVADVELLVLRLQLLACSAETAREAGCLAIAPHFAAQRALPCGMEERR